MLTSRKPPRASLRSGSRRYAASPEVCQRSSSEASSSGSRARALPRQVSRRVVRAPLTRPVSPAIARRSSRPTPALSSRPATSAHSAGVRTEWSSRIRASHRGYQRSLASRLTVPILLPSCSSTRSMSERGPSSIRARLPTAARATPLAGPPASAYSSTRADSTHWVTKRRRSGPAVEDHADRIATLRRSLVKSRFRARPARAPRFGRERCRPREPTRPCRHRCGRSERSSPGRR